MSDEPNIEDSILIDEHDVEANDGLEDGYSIALYKTSDNRHFRYIVHSDMSSDLHGVLGFDRWIAASELDSWKAL